MTFSDLIERRPFVMPAVTAAICFAVAFALWAVLLEDRKRLLADATDSIATDTADAVEELLIRQFAELETLAGDWAAFGDGHEGPLRMRARRLIEMREGLEQLRWIPVGRETEIELFPASQATDEALDVGTPPDSLAPGRFVRLAATSDQRERAEIALPVEAGGTLVARFDVDRLLSQLLQARAPRFAVGMRIDDRLVFHRGEPAPLRWESAWWQHTVPIETPFGEVWEMELRPTADYAASRLTALPHYLLALGVLLSLAFAILTHQLGQSLVRSRAQRAENLQLAEREGALTRLTAMLEARVTERTAELEDAVAELESFNYSVSHDLRSPLSAIQNFTSIVEEDHGEALGEEGLALTARIKRSAERGLRLLEDLLQLSRAGRRELAPERVDLGRLARSSFAQALAAEGSEGVELELESLPAVECDPHLIETVFDNLFTNALKYSRGRPRRRVAVGAKLEGDSVTVTVADNGCGFDMRFAPKLFQVFERLHGDDSIEGNGVGLAIVSRIIKRHRGRIWAESAPDAGARFSFSLPLSQGEEA